MHIDVLLTTNYDGLKISETFLGFQICFQRACGKTEKPIVLLLFITILLILYV